MSGRVNKVSTASSTGLRSGGGVSGGASSATGGRSSLFSTSYQEYRKSGFLALCGLLMTGVGLGLFAIYIQSDHIFSQERTLHKAVFVIIAVTFGSVLTSLGGCVLCYGGCAMIELKLTNAQIRIQKGHVQQDNRISWNSSERANEPRASIWAMNSTPAANVNSTSVERINSTSGGGGDNAIPSTAMLITANDVTTSDEGGGMDNLGVPISFGNHINLTADVT
ncbi:uncharacterized protein LOC142348239 [Convolutriloba macropyga]|uniref:uncharacterized protein LOC142348239 n=1 Tax=Convolutriloba macropyga TaxID=536237 RepID=UPI003F51B3D8